MTVVILSMAAMAIVVLISLFASKWDRKQPPEEPDLSPDEKRATAATTATLAAVHDRGKRKH